MAFTNITAKLSFPFTKEVSFEVLNSNTQSGRALRRRVHKLIVNTYQLRFTDLCLDDKNIIENTFPAPFTITIPNDGSVQLVFVEDSLVITQKSPTLFDVEFTAETFL